MDNNTDSFVLWYNLVKFDGTVLNIIVDTQLSVEAGWFAFHQPSICDWVAENQFKVIMTFTLGVYGLAGVLGTKQELDFALRES